VSILNPLYEAVAWVIMQIHAVLAVPFGASSGWAWGLSIVFLVLLMRLIMVPLFVKQVNAQRKMQSHMPQLQELKKRYKSDKQKLNEETMKFYRENGINPLSGCLPLVAQLPLFFALFSVLRAISNWQPGHPAPYGLTTAVVQSARDARIFGASLADKFLFPLPHETWSARLVILLFVLVSACTTFLTMRQSARRGMMQQGAMDPDNPAANMQKYMMYIAPFFALSGLYWQFGLVIYWVTTNVWTLGQQHILFRNLPIVGSDAAGATAAVTLPGNTTVAGKSSTSGKSGGAAKTAGTAKSAAQRAAAPKPASAGGGVRKVGSNGSAVTDSTVSDSSPSGGARGLLRFGKAKAEPEPVATAPKTNVVRQQPVRQTRSKRSGKR
jgi:YidC/Oxa1 family membrane protein insertase